jgi:hypothetical protein
MRRLLYVWRFFQVVAPVSRLLRGTIAGVAMVAALLIALDRSRAAQALTPLLVLQLFAASSGFLVPARRGYYDLVLTAGERRVVVAAIHWAAAALPGVMAFGALVAAEAIGAGGGRRALLTSGTLTAMIVVSTVPWAAGVALPRFAIGVGWLVALAGFWMLWPDAAQILNGPPTRLSASGALAALVYPPALVGEDLRVSGGWTPFMPLCAAAGSFAAALWWIHRVDLALEAH